jgi:predicted porin
VNDMKKNMIALAVAAAVVAPSAMASATLYGQMNMWMTKSDANNADSLSIQSYATKMGIKGDNDLGDGLKAIYQLEFQVDNGTNTNNTGTTGTITSRNQFAGLAGGFGTVMLGNMDSPMKSALGKVMLMEDTAGDQSFGIAKTVSEDRVERSLTYVSPKFEGVQVALQSGKMTGTQGIGTNKDEATSASVTYTGVQNLYVTAAMDKNMDNADEQRTALGAQYKMDNMVFGLVREQTKPKVGEKSNVTVVNGAYTMDKVTFALSYRTVGTDAAAAGLGQDDGDKDITVAAVYGFNKSTSAWLGVKKMDYDNSNTDDVQAVQLGFRTKF